MRRSVVAVALTGGALVSGLGLGGPGTAQALSSWRVIEGHALRAPGHGAHDARRGIRRLARTRHALELRPVDAVRVKLRGHTRGRTHGRRCRGRPVAQLLLDGSPVAHWRVPAHGRHYVHVSAPVAVPAGRHRVGVRLANPRRRGHCRRSLRVRRVKLRERVPLGTAADWPLIASDERYRTTLLGHYDSITPENRMKWQFLEPRPGSYDFGAADDLVDFATAHDLAIHGHTLVFDKQLPPWVLLRAWKPGELEAAMRSFIATVVGRYRGRIASWDVVNEPLAADGSLAPTIFERLIGPDYVAIALRAAHEADPDAKLYINEVGADTTGPKADGLYALAAKLVQDGVPLDGIGFQLHVGLGPQAPDPAALRANFARFAALGLDVAVSELDVRVSPLQAPLADQLAAQADVYRDVASACLEQPACQRFTTWGFSDATSWLGPAERPLPFDVDYQPKPAWQAIYGVLRER